MRNMNFTVLKAKAEDYEMGNIHSDPIQNLPNFTVLPSDYKTTFLSLYGIQKVGDRYFSILGDYRKEFRSLFGKPSFCWHGSHYFHCWLLRLPHCKLLIMTAKDHGTSYEYVIEEGVSKTICSEDIMEFLKWLWDTMLANPNVWGKE